MAVDKTSVNGLFLNVKVLKCFVRLKAYQLRSIDSDLSLVLPLVRRRLSADVVLQPL
jgi:hypothetical protein